METTRLVHDRIVGKEYFDSRTIEAEKNIEELKKRKAVYKCAYELVMGHSPTKVSTSNYKNVGPNYRTQGARLNGQTL